MTLPGIDASSFQGAPGRWMPLAGKISWAGVKISELSAAGSYVDPDALADLAALKAAGLGRICYLFGHPGMSAQRTVDLFLGALGKTLADDDGVALDLEVSGALSPAAVAGWAQDVCGLLEQETGRKPVVYTFIDFAAGGNCAGLGKYPLWIADPGSPAGKPRVPAPWTSWAIHQYAQSPLDRDVANYPDLAALRAALGRPAPKPKPAPREDAVLLNTGPGAVTPIAFRNGDSKVRFFPGSGDQAGLSVEFNSHPTVAVTLTGDAQAVDIPTGALGCRVIRGAAGVNVAVSVVTF